MKNHSSRRNSDLMNVLQSIDSQQIIHNKILPVKYTDMLGIKTVVKNYDFATRNV